MKLKSIGVSSRVFGVNSYQYEVISGNYFFGAQFTCVRAHESGCESAYR